MNIMFYTPFSLRSRDTEVVMREFKRHGHWVVHVSQSDGEPFNSILKSYGIFVISHNKTPFEGVKGVLKLLMQCLWLINYCRRKKIDLIFSHLESANFVASVARIFMPRTRVVICRHHIDVAKLSGFDQSITYKVTYKLAREIIVVSEACKTYMINHERVSSERIHHINLSYDFSDLPVPSLETVSALRGRFKHSNLILIDACNLVEYKRPLLLIDLVFRLRAKHVKVSLYLLGTGPLLNSARAKVKALDLQDDIIVTGYVSNVLDYIAAADLVIHPSVSESSCVFFKEAAFLGKPAIVCSGVGDFDDIIESGESGYLLSCSDFLETATEIVQSYVSRPRDLEKLGKRAKSVVLKNFSIKNNIKNYDKYLHDDIVR